MTDILFISLLVVASLAYVLVATTAISADDWDDRK
jgi:hypothetical protein